MSGPIKITDQIPLSRLRERYCLPMSFVCLECGVASMPLAVAEHGRCPLCQCVNFKINLRHDGRTVTRFAAVRCDGEV